jgi:hypothetical protein
MILDLYKFFLNITKFNYDFFQILIYIFLYSLLDMFEDIYLSFLILSNIVDSKYFLIFIPLSNMIIKYIWVKLKNHISIKIQEYTLRSTFNIIDQTRYDKLKYDKPKYDRSIYDKPKYDRSIYDRSTYDKLLNKSSNKSKLILNITKIDHILNMGFVYIMQLIGLIISVGFLVATNIKSNHTYLINSIVVIFVPIYYTYNYSYIKSKKLYLEKSHQNKLTNKFYSDLFKKNSSDLFKKNSSDSYIYEYLYKKTIRKNTVL